MSKYKRVSSGQLAPPAAATWNKFVDTSEAFWRDGQGPVPPLLESSTISTAVLSNGSEYIEPFTVCVVKKTINNRKVIGDLPSYEVAKIDSTQDIDDVNYAVSLGEGVSSKGGRVVVAGTALIHISRAAMLNRDIALSDALREGSFDSSFYCVPDLSLSSQIETPLMPFGHFKVLSFYDVEDVSEAASQANDLMYVAVDLNVSSTKIWVEFEDAIPPYSGTTLIEGSSVEGIALTKTDASNGSLSIEQTAQKITVFNLSSSQVPAGIWPCSYSREYNRMVVDSPSSGSLFPVYLEYSQGDDGTSTVRSNYQYNVRLEQGGPIILADQDPANEAGTNPHYYKRELGSRTKANHGLASYSNDLKLQISWVNETINMSTCSS